MKTIDEIISVLEEYKVYISELELEISILRLENQKLKEELNQPQTAIEEKNEARLKDAQKFSLQQIAGIVVTETSPKILILCTKLLLNKDKTAGRQVSPIIAKLISNPNLPAEAFKMIFEDITVNVGRRDLLGKYGNRLYKLMSSPNFPESLCDEVAKYYIRKYQDEHGIHEFDRFFSTARLHIAKSTPECMRKKLDDVIDLYRKQ